MLHEVAALFRLLADNNALRMLQHHAEQGADAGRTGSDDEHRVVFRYLAYACSPESRSKYVAHEQSLLVRNTVGNAVEALFCQRHTHIFGLSAVYATA